MQGVLFVVSRVLAPPGHRHTGAWTQHPPHQVALTRPPGPELSPQRALWWWPQTKGKPQPTRMVSLSTGPSSPSRSLHP